MAGAAYRARQGNKRDRVMSESRLLPDVLEVKYSEMMAALRETSGLRSAQAFEYCVSKKYYDRTIYSILSISMHVKGGHNKRLFV